MLIQSLEQKTRLAMTTVFITVCCSLVFCCFTLWKCLDMVNSERDQIYVLDGDIPFLAQRTEQETNFIMEATAHIQLFHHYFFNLPPDNKFIEWSLGRALYLADGTAMKQKEAMSEAGFYSDLVSSSAVSMLTCDSINFDEHSRKFTYYGTQVIKRRTRNQKRSLVTSGSIDIVPRSQNNPHGLMVTGWRTIENRDLSY